MDTDNPLEAIVVSFENFIATCTPSQLDHLNEALKTVKAQDAAALTPNHASYMTVTAGVAAKKGKKRVGPAKGGAKRPLNSFMAFRNYYLASLAPHTQKDISGIIKELWPADPFKAKWVMLAKAYSVLRSTREKEEVPLDKFFAICAPLIGIMPPKEYLFMMGWQLGSPRAEGQEGVDTMPQVTRLFFPDLSMLPASYTNTSLSVDDLVRHCYERGYVTEQGQDSCPDNAAELLTMAVQPVVPNDGENTLLNATIALDAAGVTYPYNALFDPTCQFDVTFDPNITEDGGKWDAFDPSVMGSSTEVGGIDWNAFLNDDSAA